MVTTTLESDYECLYGEWQDENSRVRVHIHARAGVRDASARELRQIEVATAAGTVFAMDNVTERHPCDSYNIGGQDVYSGYDYPQHEESQPDEDGSAAEDSASVHDDRD